MSWWVYLKQDGINVEIPEHREGGVFNVNGCSEAEINITYNYSPYYYQQIDKAEGLRWLDGKAAWTTVPILEKAVAELGTKRDKNYWEKTPGNAGYALSILLSWAKLHPQAKWMVH